MNQVYELKTYFRIYFILSNLYLTEVCLAKESIAISKNQKNLTFNSYTNFTSHVYELKTSFSYT